MACDLHTLHVCERCSSLSPMAETAHVREVREPEIYCMVCKDKSDVPRVAIPYSLRYLAIELATMNIRKVLALCEVDMVLSCSRIHRYWRREIRSNIITLYPPFELCYSLMRETSESRTHYQIVSLPSTFLQSSNQMGSLAPT